MRKALLPIFFLTAATSLALPARARKSPSPIGWVYAEKSGTPVLPKPASTKAKLADFARGSLAELIGSRTTRGEVWWKVRVVDPAKLLHVEGWVEADGLTQTPYGQFPSDSDLLAKMGGPFEDDFVASHTVMARYLVRQAGSKPLLLCYAGSSVLPQARLQVIRQSEGGWVAGPREDFPFAEMNSPLTKIEIRDLLGDGNECVIITETAETGAGTSLTQMVIRRIAGDSFQTLWQAPLKLRALDSYPAQTHVLSPPARNIGQAGTVTTGEVTFVEDGGVTVPAWQGKVEFFVLGREMPVQTVTVRKNCAWTGARFEPLQ